MNTDLGMQPVRNGRFKFECHKNLPCFTACCARLKLVLTPYDVIRMKSRLGLSSGEFLAAYTDSDIDKNFGLPVVRLKMRADQGRRCPFVNANGCQIYPDRPGACRIYPLGRAASKVREKKTSDEFFFIVKEPHCLGFSENKSWKVRAWVKDQGLDEYNRMNDFYMEIATGRNFRRIKTLDDRQLQMFYMGCYDLDEFRTFIFSSTFLSRFEIVPDLVRRMETDDVELMKFGCRWLKFALFGENTLTLTLPPRTSRNRPVSRG